MAIIPSKTKKVGFFLDGRVAFKIVKNSPAMIEKLKQAEQFRLQEKKFQRAKNKLLLEVQLEQRKLAGADE